MSVPEHLGHLPVWGQVLVYLLAFAPLVLLGATIVIARKRAFAQEAEEKAAERAGESGTGAGE